MAILTDDMKRVVREQRLRFYATVCENGSPNLSPKGATYVLDDERIFFAEIRSPQTVANIRRGSPVEVNVVDPFARKGYRLKGPATVHGRGTSLYAEGLEQLRQAGSTALRQASRAARGVEATDYRQAMALKLPEPRLRTAAFAASAAAAGAALSNAAPILARAAGEPRGHEGPAAFTASAGTVALAGSPPPPAPPCGVPPLRLRCPDLVMSAPYGLHVDRTTIPGRVLLRAASSINNRGRGPLEIRAHRGASRRMLVYQAVYDSRHRRHLFRSAAKLVFKHVPGARYGRGTVAAASYWKFEHAAAFQLWSLDAQGRAQQLVRAGPKIDYCLRDLVRKTPSRRSPGAPVYPACSRERRSHRQVLGTSVGWSDVYPYEYPQQWIDVTGLRGRFAYVQIVDPEHLLIESSRSNDVSETYVDLPSGRVLGHRVAVSMP